MKIRSQVGMVLNLDKCIGCHTCSVTCKNVWTSREGMEYAWFNNVESKPGIGYPNDWENQEKYNTIESIENFLFVSVKNEALNYLRGIERENNRYARLENPESEEPQIFNLFIEEETNQMLLTAIGQLPEQSARIIRLALSGLENKEISRLLDVSVNTVKTLKYSAIRKLREHFQKKAI